MTRPIPPPAPSIARALLAAAVVPAAGSWAVSWWQGTEGGGVLAGRGRQLYPDAGALAAELETYMAEPRPKGEGAALACAVFGREHGEGADSDEAAGVAKRRAGDVTRWTAVQLDAEPKGGIAPPSLPEAWEVLGGLGVSAVAHPSPSSGHEGGRWRAWLRVADHDGDGHRGVSPWALLGARVLLACAVSLGLGPVDPAPSKPEALGYVHPRPQVGPRPAGGVRWMEGGGARPRSPRARRRRTGHRASSSGAHDGGRGVGWRRAAGPGRARGGGARPPRSSRLGRD